MSANDPFSMGRAAGMGDDYRGDSVPSPTDNLSSAFAKTAGYANETGERAKAAEQANQIEPVFNAKTGTWDLGNVPNDALQAILNNAKQFGQIQQIYQKQIEYNQQQQEGLKAHPFANALSQIAASVGASSKDPLVRGLGDAAQRLNPTLPQLQQQQQGMLKGAEGALEGQVGAYGSAARISQDTRQSELARRSGADQQKGITDLMRETRLSIRGGSGQPLSYDAFHGMASAKGIRAETIPGLYKAHQEEAGLAKAGKDEDTTRKKQLETFKTQERNRLKQMNQPIDEALIDRRAQKGVEAQLKLEDQKKRLIDYREESREKYAATKPYLVPSEKDMQTLEDVSQTKQYAGDIQEALSNPENEKFFGQIRLNRLTESPWFQSMRSDEQQYIQTLIAHEKPRIISLAKAGVRGYSESQWPILKNLGGDATYSPSQMKQVIGLMIKSSNERAASILRARPLADRGMLRDLVGDDVISLADKDSKVPRVDGKASATGKKAGGYAEGFEDYVKSLPPGKKAKDPSTGKWYTNKGGTISESP